MSDLPPDSSATPPSATYRLEAYGRYCILSAFLLVPLIFSQSILETFDLAKFGFLWVLVIAALGVSTIGRIAGSMGTSRPLTIGLAAVLTFLGLAATVASPYPVISALGLHSRYGGLVTQILLFGLLVAIIGLYGADQRGLDSLAAVVAMAATLVALYTMLQAAGLDWIQWTELGKRRTVRPAGTLGNSNFNGAYLGIAFPFFIYLTVVSTKRMSRALILSAAGLACIALWHTGTRGGMLAFGAGITVMALGLRRQFVPTLKITTRSRRIALTVVAVLLLAAVAFGVSGAGQRGGLLRSESLAARVGWWESAIELIADHPWLGTGFNTFYAAVLPYGDQALAERRNLEVAFPDDPHNIFLSRAASSGLPALAVYLLMVGSSVRFAIKGLQRSEPRHRLRVVTFAAVLAAYLTQGLFSIDVIALAMLGWIAIAALAVLGSTPQRENSAPDRTVTIWTAKRKVLLVAMLAGATLLMAAITAVVAADAQARKAVEAEDGTRSLTFLERAARLQPFQAEYHFRAGWQARINAIAADDPATADALFAKAVKAYERGLELQPESIQDLFNLAVVYNNWAANGGAVRHFESADRWLAVAADLDPFDYEVAYRRSENMRMWARATADTEVREHQIEQLRLSLELYRDQPQAWVRLAAAQRALGRDAEAGMILRNYFGKIPSDERLREIVSDQAPRRTETRTRGAGEAPSGNPLDSPVAAVAGTALLAAVAIAARSFTGSRTIGASGLRRAMLDILAGPGPVAVGGAWSVALATPYLGPLFGLPPGPGEWGELAVHVGIGSLLLGAAIASDQLGARRDNRPGALLQKLRWLVLPLGVALTAVHLSTYPALDGGHPTWSRLAAHLMPGLLVVVSAAVGLLSNRRLGTKSRDTGTAPDHPVGA